MGCWNYCSLIFLLLQAAAAEVKELILLEEALALED